MYNVFYLVYGLTSGGIEKYSVTLYKYINHNNYNFDFIVKYNQREFFDDALLSAGGKKIPVYNGTTIYGIKAKLIYLRNLVSIISKDYDIAYFNLSSPAAVFKYPILCRLFGINKIIIHSHSSSEDKQTRIVKLLNVLGRKYINKITACRLACSDKAAEWMYGSNVVKNNDYIKIMNGIETDKYIFNMESRKNKRTEFGICQDTFVIGHVGRFTQAKNHLFILEVFVEILEQCPKSNLLLIGVGDLQAKIMERVKDYGIQNKVIFAGEQKNVNEILNSMDIFILPSFYEGLPIAGIEAQASGLKCIFSTNITRDSDITGNVKFLPLDCGAKEWANTALQYRFYNRKDESKHIISAGFDMKNTAIQIENQINKIMGT